MSEDITLAQLRAWLLAYADRIDERAGYLTELDAAIGDADHGANMVRGMGKVRARLQQEDEAYADVGALLRGVAMTLISHVGGAAGPLYGAFFMRAAKDHQGRAGISVAELAQMFRCGLEGVQARGKADADEKTMVDALLPAVEAMESAAAAGGTPAAAAEAALRAAEKGMKRTVALEATKGRASYLGPRSVGHQDPGATSAYYLFETLATVLHEAE
jgi:dihydroxyacetone kinase-like protein